MVQSPIWRLVDTIRHDNSLIDDLSLALTDRLGLISLVILLARSAAAVRLCKETGKENEESGVAEHGKGECVEAFALGARCVGLDRGDREEERGDELDDLGTCHIFLSVFISKKEP